MSEDRENEPSLRLLYLIPDGFPTFRPDVSVLFGEYLPKLGILSDLVAQRARDKLGLPERWNAGDALIAGNRAGRMANQLTGFFHDLRVLRAMPCGRYSAVTVRDKPFTAAVALWFARRRKIPFFFWMSFPISESAIAVAGTHGLSLGFVRYVYMMLRGHVGKFLFYRIVAPRSDFIFVQSERMRRDIAACGVAMERTMAVPMCIDPERFPETGLSPPAEEFAGREIVAYLGMCERIRRIDFLLDVVTVLKRTRPNILFLIVGDATEEEDRIWLHDQVKKRGCERHVRITGWLNPPDAKSQLSRARIVFALMAPDPILDSTTPTKLVEYMAMGKAVVANKHPDQSFLLAQSGAGHCVPFDIASFAAAAIDLLDNPERAAEMGKRGRAYVLEHRSYPNMAGKLADAFRSLLVY